MKQEVTVYTTTTCPVCSMLKNFLEINEVPYKEINVDFHPLALIKLIAKTGKFTVPQTNFNGQWISGFDPVSILKVIIDNTGSD
ncbi:glutaredoxin family protein [Bacillus kwashiorkori]|uniref:glutaredoxin family protein n=1 Tax=Bacillus kwashiorkori TaxID=1522318 RepID=UPI000782B9D9|nr:glutaredoxin family protein [Bacillus kwashiorkori]